MRTAVWIGALLVLCCAGCNLTRPLRNPDSIDNATAETWTITADFKSGLHHEYEQAPDSFANFGMMSRGELPVLTNILAVSQDTPARTCALSERELERLRAAVPGGLTLVLYPDGIACLSPDIKKALESDLQKGPYTREEYFRALRAQGPWALQWTRLVLKKQTK